MKIDSAILDRAHATFQQLAQRCAELGVVLLHCDANGKIIAASSGAAEHFRTGIEQAANSQWVPGRQLDPVEAAPGEWLVPLEDKVGSRRIAMNVAVVAAENPTKLKRMSRVLQWSFDELQRSEHDGRTIDQFSEKLAQAYEETNLLYRMAHLLNCEGDPVQSIQTVAMQLQQVMPFGWLAIRFSEQCRAVRDLSGKTMLAGNPPCSIETIKSMSDPMLSRPSIEGWNKLLNPGSDPLAAATGAEVLVEPITHDQRVIGLLLAGNKSGPDPELSSFEMQFLDATADFLGVFHENLARFAEQQEMFLGTLRALTASIDAKDRYTRGHSERVGLMASKMAEAMGMDKQLIEQYRIAGIVHDVGKIGVPEPVLTKPGRLTEEEFAQIKLHPGIGHNILKDIPSLAPVLPGVLWHHERWDGRGYPDGIAGEQIPMIARVLALADTFDAMSSTRSYRPAMPRRRVLEEITKCAGSQFDPKLAPLFVSLDFSDFDQALEMHREREQQQAAA